jgi:hypothetical protein
MDTPWLADHRFSHSPSMAYPLAGCFVSATAVKCGSCADSLFDGIPLRRREKRPFWVLLWPISRRFSPFEKTAGFSPKSTFSPSKRRYSPLFS